MNPFEGRLLQIGVLEGGLVGQVSVRGALRNVSLQLVPDARPGDLVLCDAGVAVSILSVSDSSKEKHNVPRNPRYARFA